MSGQLLGMGRERFGLSCSVPGCRFAYALVSSEADDEEVEQGANKNFGECCVNSHEQIQCNLNYLHFDYPNILPQSWHKCIH